LHFSGHLRGPSLGSPSLNVIHVCDELGGHGQRVDRTPFATPSALCSGERARARVFAPWDLNLAAKAFEGEPKINAPAKLLRKGTLK
jgi:hypothetical protein